MGQVMSINAEFELGQSQNGCLVGEPTETLPKAVEHDER